MFTNGAWLFEILNHAMARAESMKSDHKTHQRTKQRANDNE